MNYLTSLLFGAALGAIVALFLPMPHYETCYCNATTVVCGEGIRPPDTSWQLYGIREAD